MRSLGMLSSIAQGMGSRVLRPSMDRGVSKSCRCAVMAPSSLSSSPAPPLPGNKILYSADLEDDDPHMAYELLQGPLVRWSRGSPNNVPTAVLVHGILGQRRNMQTFARMFAGAYPAWQVLLVDLRCHGESASLSNKPNGPHTVETSAKDVLELLRNLGMFPRALIGHSFGGKVVMSMVQQFGNKLPRPVQVWVLDSLPGENVRAGEGSEARDHPKKLIQALKDMPTPIDSRAQVMDVLARAGFSKHIAQWAATNLRKIPGSEGQEWTFDLDGIQEMYDSYENHSLWPLVENPPSGLKLDFVKAEGSTFRWGGSDEDRILQAGHQVHLLRNSGHWVHSDNPSGLLDTLSTSFGEVDLHFQHAKRK